MADLKSFLTQLFTKGIARNRETTPTDDTAAASRPRRVTPTDPSVGQRFLAAMKGGREGGVVGLIDGARNPISSQEKARPVLKPRPVATRPRVVNPSDSTDPATSQPPSEINALDFVNKMRESRANLPALPTYTPHEKHGFGERILGFFEGGRRGGLAAAIRGARNPEEMEYRQFLQDKLYPAMMQRKIAADEAHSLQTADLELLKALSSWNKDEREAALNQRKQEWEENKPLSVPEGSTAIRPKDGKIVLRSQKPRHVDTSLEFAREWNPEANGGKGAYEFITGDDEQPMRSRQYLENESRNKAAMDRTIYTQGEQNKRTRYTQDRTDRREVMKEAGRNARHKTRPQPGENNFDKAIINDLIKNEPAFKGKTPAEVRHMLEMRGMKYIAGPFTDE